MCSAAVLLAVGERSARSPERTRRTGSRDHYDESGEPASEPHMAADVFPSTMRTWIDRALDRDDEGRLEVNRHIMKTYAWPLKVYYLGTNSRWLGEPDDIVHGFFAARLQREDFLPAWRESGMRLRRWLMNGFCYYLMEIRRERKKGQTPIEQAEEPMTFAGDPMLEVDRAAVVAFVRQALELAAEQCEQEGLADHWEIFLRHHNEDAPFKTLAADFGVDAARAAVMARTAGRKFKAALRDVLARDGVKPQDIDSEIQALLEVTNA